MQCAVVFSNTPRSKDSFACAAITEYNYRNHSKVELKYKNSTMVANIVRLGS